MGEENAATPAVPEATPAPTIDNEEKKNDSSEEFSAVEDEKPFNFPVMLNWITAVLAISGVVFFYLLSKDLSTKASTLEAEKQVTVSEITGSNYSEVEKQASSFKSAVLELQEASRSRYLLKDFLPKLYAHIAKNVVLGNVSISETGELSLDGKTDSYNSIAKQFLALKDWKVDEKNVINDVKLLSSSATVTEAGKIEASFAISATIDKSISMTIAADLSGTDSTSSTADTSGLTTDSSLLNADSVTPGGTSGQ